MKYIKKINIIIIIFLLIGLTFSNYSQASEIGNIFSDADKFLTEGNSVGSVVNETQLQKTSNFMYKLLLSIGIIVMFIVGTILGIQFMIASAEDKAKVKEALVPYIIGCVVIFGAFTIWSIVVNIGQDVIGLEHISTYTQVYCCARCGQVIDTELTYMCSAHGIAGGMETRYKCNHCNRIISRSAWNSMDTKKCTNPKCGYLLKN